MIAYSELRRESSDYRHAAVLTIRRVPHPYLWPCAYRWLRNNELRFGILPAKVLRKSKPRYPAVIWWRGREVSCAQRHRCAKGDTLRSKSVQEQFVKQSISTISASRPESRVVVAMVAALAGLGILWCVGFSDIDILHNAAHDVRHSNIFPCH